MLSELESTVSGGVETSALEDIAQDVSAACGRIPPLWDLSNYVAVNPFLGFAAMPIEQAVPIVEAGLGARVLPPMEYYRGRWERGEIDGDRLAAAARRTGNSPSAVRSALQGGATVAGDATGRIIRTVGERCQRTKDVELDRQLIRSVARWCAVYASRGGAQWGVDGDGAQGFYSFWRESAGADRSLEILGLHGWREWVRELPGDSAGAIAAMSERLEISAADRVDYFYRQLGRLYGWASWFRRATWQQDSSVTGDVGELLAVLLSAEAGLARVVDLSAGEGARHEAEDTTMRLACQEALEDEYANGLIGALNPPAADAAERPMVQAVFCIDVRSEPLRRHFEAQSEAIETRGFAGFFGVSLDWQAGGTPSARCPVLLRPSVSLRCGEGAKPGGRSAAGQYLQSAPASAFSFVEVLGLGYGIKMASDALKAGDRRANVDHAGGFDLAGGVAAEARVEMAGSILKNMGLTRRFARLVMLCGHEGHSANNPHAAGLDCGACGGHGGAINARVASALLNDPAVRAGLAERGTVIPTDTHFLPAVHDTGTDEVKLLDVENVPASHTSDLARLSEWLGAAGERVRQERAPALGLGAAPTGVLGRLFKSRSRDWSEVRPEWGLARNASFIAARRARTRGVDLGGRAFLHEYDASADVDGSVLTLILSAPMVVASWINLQYFASTVDNDVFGCGNKTLHNRIGDLGVVLGNGGDLRTGLAAQSVHAADGSWYHEPLRLQVIVEAPRKKIEAVLAAQPGVRNLVENGWVRLFSLDPDGGGVARWMGGVGWEAAFS